MADRSVTVRYRADISQYAAGMKKAEQQTRDFGSRIGKFSREHEKALTTVGTTATVAGGAVLAGVGLMVKTYADFEKAMSGVGAVAGANAKEMQQLSDAALKAGADTAFSASQAADAEAELAKAGISVSDILSGALMGSMSLAAAGQIDLAQSAEISGQAMKIFGLRGKDVGRIADVLTAGANKSAAGVDDLGQALQQGGLVAAQTGLTMEETVATLSAFADNALKGSDAGTSLKTMLQRLTPQSKEAAKKMEELGFSAYDAQGNFIGLPGLAKEMHDSFKELTPEARNSAMALVFGSDAVRGANILYKEGERGIRDYIRAVHDQGAAARVAAKQMDNLSGDIEQFKGSLETAFITTGKAGSGPLRDLTQRATDLVNAYSDLPETAKTAVFWVGAVGGTALAAAGSVALLLPKVNNLIDSWQEMSKASPGAVRGMRSFANAASIAGVAIPVATAAFEGLHQAITDAKNLDGPGLSKTTNALIDFAHNGKATGELAGTFGKDLSGLVSTIGTLDGASGKVVGFTKNLDWLMLPLKALPDPLQKNVAALKDTDDALARLASGGNADMAAQIFKEIATEAKAQGLTVAQVKKQFPRYVDALAELEAQGKLTKDQVMQLSGGITRTGREAEKQAPILDAFGNVLVDADGKATDAATAIKNLGNSIRGLGADALAVSDAQISFQQAIDAATEAAKKNKHTLDIHTKAGQENRTILNQMARAGHEVTATLTENAKAGGYTRKEINQITASMKQGRQALIEHAIKLGADSKQAERLADQAGYTRADIDKVRESLIKYNHTHGHATISVSTSRALMEIEQVQSAINALKGRHVPITVEQTNAFNKMQAMAGVRRAGGGPIIGPGTGTSDSVPVWGSNGEHMWTAAEVAAAGGHGAVAALRQAVLSGAVAPNFAAHRVTAARPAGVGPSKTTYQQPVYVDKLYSQDVSDFRHQAEKERRLAALGQA